MASKAPPAAAAKTEPGKTGDAKKEVEKPKPKFGTPEWQAAYEAEVKKFYEERKKAQKDLHEKMDKSWKETYLETEEYMNALMPMEDPKAQKKKDDCKVKVDEKKPLDSHCDVAAYKECLAESIAKKAEEENKKKDEVMKKLAEAEQKRITEGRSSNITGTAATRKNRPETRSNYNATYDC